MKATLGDEFTMPSDKTLNTIKVQGEVDIRDGYKLVYERDRKTTYLTVNSYIIADFYANEYKQVRPFLTLNCNGQNRGEDIHAILETVVMLEEALFGDSISERIGG